MISELCLRNALFCTAADPFPPSEAPGFNHHYLMSLSLLAGNDGLIKVWDASSLELKKTLEGHENEVRVLKARDDKLFSGDMNGKASCAFEQRHVTAGDISKMLK